MPVMEDDVSGAGAVRASPYLDRSGQTVLPAAATVTEPERATAAPLLPADDFPAGSSKGAPYLPADRCQTAASKAPFVPAQARSVVRQSVPTIAEPSGVIAWASDSAYPARPDSAAQRTLPAGAVTA